MGTRLRHFKSKNLRELEAFIQSLAFKIEIKEICFVKSEWYVHFTVGEFQDTEPLKELLKKKEAIKPLNKGE